MISGSRKISTTTYGRNLTKILLIWFLVFLTSFFFNWYFTESNLNNLFWSIVTFGSVFTFLFAILMMDLSQTDIKKIITFCVVVTIIQIGLGYSQMVLKFSTFNPFGISAAAGDYFTGTFLRYGYAHVAALKISLILIYVFVLWISNKSWLRFIVLLTLVVGWIMPSALYSVLILSLSTILYFTFFELIPRLRFLKFKTSILLLLILGVVGTIFFFSTQARNTNYISNSIENIKRTALEGDDSNISAQKVHFIRKSLVEVPSQYPQTFIIGTGPGNYSSRAAWIVSGIYLTNHPSYIPITPSKVAKEYSIPFFEDIVNGARWGAGSIVHQPFSSWTAILIETGIPGLLLIALFFYFLNKRNGLSNNYISDLSKGNIIATIYVVLLMAVDNVLEYPQFMNQYLLFIVMINNVNVGQYQINKTK